MIKILKGPEGSAMYDEETEIFFGPLFALDEDPDDFIEWLKNSPREYPNVSVLRNQSFILNAYIDEWRTELENDNEAKAERYFSDTEATTLDEQMEKARKMK